MESVKYNNHNLIIRMLCLFMIVILCLFMIPSGSAQAVAGFDDAIIFSILNQAFMSAAGANFVVGSNGVPVTEDDPITEAILKDIYTKGELDRKFYEIIGQEVSDFIESIDWDNVFTVASGSSNIIANLPKVAVDTLTLFAKGLITELGATSNTAVDWNTESGNISNFTNIDLSGFNFRLVSQSNPLSRIAYGHNCPCYPINNSYPVYGGFCYTSENSTAYNPVLISEGSFTLYDSDWNGSISRPADQTSSGYYMKVGMQWGSDVIPSDSISGWINGTGGIGEILSQSDFILETDDLTMTLVPESDTEAMVYPESTVEDYPNVESIPYYTDIPYIGSIPDTGVIPYTEAIPYLQEAVQSNTLTASLEATQEGTITVPDGSVTIPLFNITLPDFQFNFTGIWYYVIQWVNSLGAWLSQMFTIWGILPASMVYPVWATAVIVIVLGVYKRFFM